MNRLVAERTNHGADVAVGIGLLVLVALHLILLNSTPPDTGEDVLFDSHLYWPSWFVPPLLIVAASWLRPAGVRPFVWASLVAAPWMIAIALAGTVFFDEDQGASFWLVGELFVLVQAGIGLTAALILNVSPLARTKL